MNIQSEKKWIIAEVDKTNDVDVLHVVKSILDFAKKKTNDVTLKPMSLGEFYSKIEKSRSDIDNGRTVPHSEVKKIIKTWRKGK